MQRIEFEAMQKELAPGVFIWQKNEALGVCPEASSGWSLYLSAAQRR